MYESSARKPGATRGIQKSPFYHSFGHLTSTKWREGCENEVQNSHFTSVLDVRWARNDERVATNEASKFAFHLSFGRPMSTKRREGCQTTEASKFAFHHSFRTSDEHETTRGLRRRASKFAFHHSFGRPTSTKWREGCDGELQKFAFHHSFGRPTSTKWREGGLPSWSTKPTLRKKKKEILKKFWSTTILSRSSQQIFSADLLSRSSQQIVFIKSSQQILSADLLSRFSLSRFSSADFLQQIFSADLLSRFSQQIFSADLLIVLSFAVVRGWWSAIVLSFLSFAVVRGWWSAIVLSCWWSILHEFFRRTLSRSFREKTKIWSTNNSKTV